MGNIDPPGPLECQAVGARRSVVVRHRSDDALECQNDGEQRNQTAEQNHRRMILQVIPDCRVGV